METNNIKNQIITELSKLNDNASIKEIYKSINDCLKQNNLVVSWISRFGHIAMIIGLFLAIDSILYIELVPVKYNYTILKEKIVNSFDIFIYAFWIIIPPSWFLFEYTWLFPNNLRQDTNEISDLKYKHELAGKVWAGLVGLITLLLYIKYKEFHF